MRPTRPHPETLLESGFVLLSAGVAAGLVVLLAGRVFGDARRQRRETELPPPTGSIPRARHQHLSPSPR